MGQYCQTALCYPQCMNGGLCTAPAVCSCPKGYQGRHCEGGKSILLNTTKRTAYLYGVFNHFSNLFYLVLEYFHFALQHVLRN